MSLADFSDSALLLIILGLTLMSAYFASSETAMMALNRYRLRHSAGQQHKGAGKALKLLQRPDQLLGVILIGNNFVNFLAAGLGTVVGMRLFGDTGVVLAPIVLTLFFLVFADVVPKTVATQQPERLAFASAHLLAPLLRLTRPLVWLINAVSNVVARPFIGAPSATDDRLSAGELRTLLRESAQVSGRHKDMLLSILDLEKVTVNDIMVPRDEIIGLDLSAPMEGILQVLANSQHTRLPVYQGHVNNMLGMLHLRRLARHAEQGNLTKQALLQLAHPPHYVPEATPLHTQLVNFQREKRRMALVVDEYGDLQGLVTLEDILEEIVGEFTTDFAGNIPEIVPAGEGAYFIDGGALLRDINRLLDWDLPTDGPKTLNGLVVEALETIPETNLCLRIGDYLIETLQIKDNVIKHLKVAKAAVPTASSGDSSPQPPP